MQSLGLSRTCDLRCTTKARLRLQDIVRDYYSLVIFGDFASDCASSESLDQGLLIVANHGLQPMQHPPRRHRSMREPQLSESRSRINLTRSSADNGSELVIKFDVGVGVARGEKV